MSESGGILAVIPHWFIKLPNHIQFWIVGLVGVHLAIIFGAILYYQSNVSKLKPFKGKLT